MSDAYYERLLDRDSRVVALQCEDVPATLGHFALLSRRSGRAIYHWTGSSGLQSLKASDIAVPGSRPLVEALRYVVQTMHYGVYLFSDFEAQLSSTPMNYLIQLAAEPQVDERKVVLLGRHRDLPRPLARVADLVHDEGSQKLQLKLRDGRWVMA